MTQVISRFEELRTAIGGTLVTPDDPGYDEARRVWNADIDRRPEVIAYCTSTEDVAAAVTFARDASLEISVRSGAHSTSGSSVGDAGIVIDLSRMNDVEVDPAARRATVGGGALLRDVDAATQIHGLAVPCGEIGHTGIGGITLGGGMGWLTRRHGLTIDNLLAARVVLADGRVVRAAADEHPDLFWAIRGGGGNFGIATSFEFALHEVGPLVDVGLLFYGLDQAADALRMARDLTGELPDDVAFQVVALYAPPAPFVPEEFHFRLGFALVAVGFAAPEAHREVVERMRTTLPPLFEMVTPTPFTALQQMFDEAYAWGRSRLREVDVSGDVLRRRHRRDRRAGRRDGLADVGRAFLRARRGVLPPRRRRHRLQRWAFAAPDRVHHRVRRRGGRPARRARVGARVLRRPLPAHPGARAPTSTASPATTRTASRRPTARSTPASRGSRPSTTRTTCSTATRTSCPRPEARSPTAQ